MKTNAVLELIHSSMHEKLIEEIKQQEYLEINKNQPMESIEIDKLERHTISCGVDDFCLGKYSFGEAIEGIAKVLSTRGVKIENDKEVINKKHITFFIPPGAEPFFYDIKTTDNVSSRIRIEMTLYPFQIILFFDFYFAIKEIENN
jgi:hypothetical protein